MYSVELIPHLPGASEQSGTKPNLEAKILATKFGVFFCYRYI